MEGSTSEDPRMKVHKMVRRTIWVVVALGFLAIVYLYINGQGVYANVV